MCVYSLNSDNQNFWLIIPLSRICTWYRRFLESNGYSHRSEKGPFLLQPHMKERSRQTGICNSKLVPRIYPAEVSICRTEKCQEGIIKGGKLKLEQHISRRFW